MNTSLGEGATDGDKMVAKCASAMNEAVPDKGEMIHWLGSKSSSWSYGRLSVILSDGLDSSGHRFRVIYLDADTIFLWDWEEWWGWKGAFAYRWLRLEKHNTAVSHLNKGPALGLFLFRATLKNGLGSYPMSDAQLEELLVRFPDALFNPAWLNTDFYQRKQSPQPCF